MNSAFNDKVHYFLAMTSAVDILENIPYYDLSSYKERLKRGEELSKKDYQKILHIIHTLTKERLRISTFNSENYQERKNFVEKLMFDFYNVKACQYGQIPFYMIKMRHDEYVKAHANYSKLLHDCCEVRKTCDNTKYLSLIEEKEASDEYFHIFYQKFLDCSCQDLKYSDQKVKKI